MNSLPDTVCHYLDSHITPGEHLWVGLSGGLDSVLLLHWLLAWQQRSSIGVSVQALHVHHGLSANADAWADFCAALCRSLQVPLEIERVQVVNGGDGIELAAREARYQAYRRHCDDGDCLLLAHHADDQIETLMLRLRRGCGLRGLGAMAQQRWLDEPRRIRLLRPLLDIPRQQLLEAAQIAGLDWVEDESNQDSRYERNWWRNELLPRWFGRFPQGRQPLLRSIRRWQQDQQVLDLLVDQALAPCLVCCDWPLTAVTGLSVEAVLAADPRLQEYLIRRWLESLHVHLPDEQRLAQIRSSLLLAADDRQPLVRVGKGELRRFRGVLYWLPSVVPDQLPEPVILASDTWLPWAGGILQVAEDVRRQVSQGGRWQIVAAGACKGMVLQQSGRPSRQLSRLWQEQGIPPWLRSRWPLLLNDQQLLVVAGIAVAANSDLTPQSLRWCRNPEPLV